MPAPLIAKGKTKLSPIEQAIVSVLIGGPLVGLWYCYHHGGVIHFDNPWLNLSAHAALFIVPLIWVVLVFAKPIVYEAPGENTVIAIPTFFNRCRLGWWTMMTLWAAPVVGIVVLGHALLTHDLAQAEILSTSFGKAVGIIALVFCLGFFYGEILAGKDQPAVWISDEGLRTSILRFHKWKDIHHMSQQGSVYTLYNHVNPAFPASAFEVRDPAARALLERRLAQHQIRVCDNPSPAFLAVKIGVVLGFLGTVAFCLWLRFYLSFSFISVVLISFGIGIALCLLFEKIRSVSRFGKIRPVLEFSDDDDDVGDAPRPTV